MVRRRPGVLYRRVGVARMVIHRRCHEVCVVSTLRALFCYRDHERWYTVKFRYGASLAFVVGTTMVGTPFQVRWPL